MTNSYPGIKIHLAIQQYTGDKLPYIGIGIKFNATNDNTDEMPSDMVCMAMPITTNSTNITNDILEETSTNTTWDDNLDDDEEFELHQTILRNQMDIRTIETNETFDDDAANNRK